MRAAARQVEPEIVDDGLNVEVINGVKLMSPRPTPGHARAALELGSALLLGFDDQHRRLEFGRPPSGPGGWIVMSEPELQLGKNTLIPDLAAWRTPRLPKLPKTAYIAVAPDWVCEVLSPSTMTIDRHTKMPAYASAGVSNVWLIDVKACAIEVYRLDESQYGLVATHTGRRRTRIEPFIELPLPLGRLWPV